jgi:glutamate racemase
MRLLITDSGVGGLSVCAYAEEFLRTHDIGEPIRLTYVNASPENDFGYNSMASRSEKLENFDRFLHIVAEKYAPDLIYVACNTLSVLMADTVFAKNTVLPIRGIVESGVGHLVRDLGNDPDSIVAIFGTPTTIDEQTYSNRLMENGIDGSRIVAQACPSLADTISEDLRGSDAQAKIAEFVGEAIKKTVLPPTRHLTYLACTHYGYRKDFFAAAFAEHGIRTRVDPKSSPAVRARSRWSSSPAIGFRKRRSRRSASSWSVLRPGRSRPSRITPICRSSFEIHGD